MYGSYLKAKKELFLIPDDKISQKWNFDAFFGGSFFYKNSIQKCYFCNPSLIEKSRDQTEFSLIDTFYRVSSWNIFFTI